MFCLMPMGTRLLQQHGHFQKKKKSASIAKSGVSTTTTEIVLIRQAPRQKRRKDFEWITVVRRHDRTARKNHEPSHSKETCGRRPPLFPKAAGGLDKARDKRKAWNASDHDTSARLVAPEIRRRRRRRPEPHPASPAALLG